MHYFVSHNSYSEYVYLRLKHINFFECFTNNIMIAFDILFIFGYFKDRDCISSLHNLCMFYNYIYFSLWFWKNLDLTIHWTHYWSKQSCFMQAQPDNTLLQMCPSFFFPPALQVRDDAEATWQQGLVKTHRAAFVTDNVSSNFFSWIKVLVVSLSKQHRLVK